MPLRQIIQQLNRLGVMAENAASYIRDDNLYVRPPAMFDSEVIFEESKDESARIIHAVNLVADPLKKLGTG